jgi:Immunity protein 49
MDASNFVPNVVQGLKDIEWCSEPDQRAIQLIETKEGSREGCLSGLVRNARAAALQTYFRDHNLQGLKQWSYVASKLAIMRMHLEPQECYLAESLLWPLLSDNTEVINWFAQNHAMYHPEKPSAAGGDKDNPKSWMYYRYQSWLALNARWDELGERCERILAMEAEIKKDRAYLIDHRFYLALAKGDKSGMQSVLLEKCEPKNRKTRYDQESGLTNNFIVSYATLFAKLARHHGHELDLDTPWIPKDWILFNPNARYEDPWPFMQNFDIWQPLPEPYAIYSPTRV